MARQGWVEVRAGTNGNTYRVRFWAPNASGELVPKSKSFPAVYHGGNRKAKDAADAFLARMLTEVRDGTYLPDTRLTLGELITKWIDVRKSEGMSLHTVYSYRSAVRCHVTRYPDFAGIPIKRLTPMHIDAHSALLIGNGVGVSVMNTVHRIIRASLNRAVEWRLLAVNPIAGIKRPEVRPHSLRYWTPEESATFLTLEGDARFGLIYRMLLLTGMRVGELLALRWTDVDLVRRTIRIERTMTRNERGTYVVGTTTKTANSRRTIQLPESVLEPLRRHRVEQVERQLAAPVWVVKDGDLIFTQRDGHHLRYQTVLLHFNAAVARHGLPPLTLHGLRHSFATALLIAGVHPSVAADLLGDSVEVVLKVYSHVTESSKHDAMTNLDEQITRLQTS